MWKLHKTRVARSVQPSSGPEPIKFDDIRIVCNTWLGFEGEKSRPTCHHLLCHLTFQFIRLSIDF